MITRLSTIPELKQLFVETLLNKTNKVTKVSDESVLNGVAYGVAKVAQKALKDIAIVETHIFPDLAFGNNLDQIADKLGIAERFGSSASSVYVRLVGSPGTTYLNSTHIFTASGINFNIETDTTIGVAGYTYAKLRSQTLGIKSNVESLSINQVSPVPSGHEYVINEYQATGGRDVEDDGVFKIRIKEGANLAAKGTIASLEQAFIKINPNILKVYYHGISNISQPILAIVTQNGIALSTNELDELKSRSGEYFNLLDLNQISNTPNVEIKNIDFQAIDVSFRVELRTGALSDDVRKDIQTAFAQEVDYRFWKPGQRVEWDNLLQIVKDHPDVNYVPDTFFFPNNDVQVDLNKLPRIRGFLMLDTDGNIIENIAGTLSPFFYPNDLDFSFQSTILSSI